MALESSYDSPRRWGPGGLEIDVTGNDEPQLILMLESVRAATRPTGKRIAAYARALTDFQEVGGPLDAAAVGKVLGLVPPRRIHSLLNPKGTEWNAVRLRRRLAVAFMPDDVQAIVLNEIYTESKHAAEFAILTAHAIGLGWRVLIGAQRVKLGQQDVRQATLAWQEARRALVSEVMGVLNRRSDVDANLPVISGSTHVGQSILPLMVEHAQFSYMVGVEPEWSYGGMVPDDQLDALHVPMNAGGTIRALFGMDGHGEAVRTRSVLLTTYSQQLGHTAVALGTPPEERFFVGRARPDRSRELQAESVLDRAREIAETFGPHDWAGVADDYGLMHFRCPGDQAFQRHCTAFTLRDCFAAE